MRFFSLLVMCLALAACESCKNCYEDKGALFYAPQASEDCYKPENAGKIIRAAGFDIKEGQQMRDFFDEFKEPMHAKYVGNDNILWTYYINPENGKIVRYCELEKYAAKSLCVLNVLFYKTYVSTASSDCLL